MEVPTTGAGLYDVAFFFSAWLVASLCGILSTVVDHKHHNSWDVLSIGCLSGFVAVACIGFIAEFASATWGREPYFLALAVACGLLGKQSIRFVYFIVGTALAKVGVDEHWFATVARESEEFGNSFAGRHDGNNASPDHDRTDAGGTSLGAPVEDEPRSDPASGEPPSAG